MLRDARVDVNDQLEALVCRLAADQAGDAGHRVLQIEAGALEGQLAGLDLGEVEDVVDDAQKVLAGLVDLAHIVALARRELGLERQKGHADDRVHRCADLVTHVGEELALHACGLLGQRLALACGPRLLFHLPPPRDVAPRAHHLHRLAVAVHDAQLVCDPQPIAVGVAEPVLEFAVTGLPDCVELGVDPRQIVRMHALRPELGIAQVVLGGVAQLFGQIRTDKGRRKRLRVIAVDDCRRIGEQKVVVLVSLGDVVKPCRGQGLAVGLEGLESRRDHQRNAASGLHRQESVDDGGAGGDASQHGVEVGGVAVEHVWREIGQRLFGNAEQFEVAPVGVDQTAVCSAQDARCHWAGVKRGAQDGQRAHAGCLRRAPATIS